MKTQEKKVNTPEEAKKKVQTEEEGVQLTDEELVQVNAAGIETTELELKFKFSTESPSRQLR